MTNEEIVKALRWCADSWTGCGDCIFYERDRCVSELKTAAADLIENQQNHIRALLQANDALRPALIPVTERLPEPETRVLVLDRHGHMMDRTMRQLPTDKTPVFRPDGLMPGKHVTHWMPLPPVPEEE